MPEAHLDDLTTAIAATQLERERLHELGAPRSILERNRRQLVRLQREFSYALIERYGSAARRAA